MATYSPKVYRQQGATELVVSSGGMIAVEDGGILNIEAGGALQIGGSAFITTGGNLAIGSLTSGNVTFPGKVTATSGIAASTAAITSGASFGGAVSFTSGITATTGNFSGGIAVSSAGSFGAALSLTSGLQATTGNFSGGVAVSSALSVANTLTLSSGFVRPFEQFATGAANPSTMASHSISEVWSSAAGSTAGRTFNLPAPVAGVEKWLICIGSTATAPAIVKTTAAYLIDNSITTILFTTGATNRQWWHLMGQNTTNWMTLDKSTDMLTSTT